MIGEKKKNGKMHYIASLLCCWELLCVLQEYTALFPGELPARSTKTLRINEM